MTRIYSDFTGAETKQLLDRIADRATSPDDYKQAMLSLGRNLGDVLLAKIDPQRSRVYLAATVEDADFLAQGILERLEAKVSHLDFACFWNQREVFDDLKLTVAPILKKYQEPTTEQVNYLIVVKSVIFGACVVRTNLENLIQKIDPQEILIVAPVIYHQAKQSLAESFNPDLANKFQFVYFAEDDCCNEQGELIPGIGGSIYNRLGFAGQDEKNQYLPQLVKTRRDRIVKQRQLIH
jgi:hypothetical protein